MCSLICLRRQSFEKMVRFVFDLQQWSLLFPCDWLFGMVILHALLLVLCTKFIVTLCEPADESFYWNIANQTGIVYGQSLRLRKLNHPINHFHTCYEVACDGNDCAVEGGEKSPIQVCYPALVVSGLPKCGTSAMYAVLSKFPRAITMREKENCPFKGNQPLWNYFRSLPRMSAIGKRNITIDGCLMTDWNMKIRQLLHDPQTYYIVMVRDYTDMLWSAYNFWCTSKFDGDRCDDSISWADPKLHVRSTELFHNLLESKKDFFLEGPWAPMRQPCAKGKDYFTGVYHRLQSNRHHNHTIIVANEELEMHPLKVAHRIARAIHYNIDGIDLSGFNKIRINAQDNKGTNSVTSVDKYLPGRYNISNYRPVLPESRALINQCWYEDCIALSKIPPYYKYTACHPDTSNSSNTINENRLVLPAKHVPLTP